MKFILVVPKKFLFLICLKTSNHLAISAKANPCVYTKPITIQALCNPKTWCTDIVASNRVRRYTVPLAYKIFVNYKVQISQFSQQRPQIIPESYIYLFLRLLRSLQRLVPWPLKPTTHIYCAFSFSTNLNWPKSIS